MNTERVQIVFKFGNTLNTQTLKLNNTIVFVEFKFIILYHCKDIDNMLRLCITLS